MPVRRLLRREEKISIVSLKEGAVPAAPKAATYAAHTCDWQAAAPESGWTRNRLGEPAEAHCA